MALEPLPLVRQSYDLSVSAASSARLINMYPEKMPEGARSPFILKPSPGLASFQTVGAGPIYALEAMPGLIYAASGTRFYRLKSFNGTSFVQEDLGDIGPPSLRTSIAIGPDQVVVVNPPNAYIASHDGTLNQIVRGEGNFPQEGVSSVCYLDGYFVFTSLDGFYFIVSKLLDGGNFDGLDYARSERRPDVVQWCVSHNGEVWFFGLDNLSVWYNAGAADFPLRNRLGSNKPQGLASFRTVCDLDGSLFFLGSDRIVYRTNGYNLVRVSDHALEELLQRYETVRDITACSFMFEGHAFYALRMPTAPGGGRTFIYDAATLVWHERTSLPIPEGVWRVDKAVQFTIGYVFGDAVSGNLYTMERNFFTDNGVPIVRRVVTPPLVTHGPRAFMSRLEIEMEVASGEAPGAIQIEWSDDGGKVWTPPRAISTGAMGETRARVATTRLGSFRQRIFRLTSFGRTTIFGADAEIVRGDA